MADDFDILDEEVQSQKKVDDFSIVDDFSLLDESVKKKEVPGTISPDSSTTALESGVATPSTSSEPYTWEGFGAIKTKAPGILPAAGTYATAKPEQEFTGTPSKPTPGHKPEMKMIAVDPEKKLPEQEAKENPAFESIQNAFLEMPDLFSDVGSMGKAGKDKRIEFYKMAYERSRGDSKEFNVQEFDKLVNESEKKFEDANELYNYQKLLAKNPDNTDYQYAVGFRQMNLGKTQEAVDNFKAVIAKNPKYSPAYSAMAYLYSDKGQNDVATMFMDDAIENNPNDAALYSNRSIIKQRSGDVEGAIRDLDLAKGKTQNKNIQLQIEKQYADVFQRLYQNRDSKTEKYIAIIKGEYNPEDAAIDQDFFKQRYNEHQRNVLNLTKEVAEENQKFDIEKVKRGDYSDFVGTQDITVPEEMESYIRAKGQREALEAFIVDPKQAGIAGFIMNPIGFVARGGVEGISHGVSEIKKGLGGYAPGADIAKLAFDGGLELDSLKIIKGGLETAIAGIMASTVAGSVFTGVATGVEALPYGDVISQVLLAPITTIVGEESDAATLGDLIIGGALLHAVGKKMKGADKVLEKAKNKEDFTADDMNVLQEAIKITPESEMKKTLDAAGREALLERKAQIESALTDTGTPEMPQAQLSDKLKQSFKDELSEINKRLDESRIEETSKQAEKEDFVKAQIEELKNNEELSPDVPIEHYETYFRNKFDRDNVQEPSKTLTDAEQQTEHFGNISETQSSGLDPVIENIKRERITPDETSTIEGTERAIREAEQLLEESKKFVTAYEGGKAVRIPLSEVGKKKEAAPKEVSKAEVKAEEPIAEIMVEAEEGNFTKKGDKWYDEKNVEVKDPEYVQYLNEEAGIVPIKEKPLSLPNEPTGKPKAESPKRAGAKDDSKNRGLAKGQKAKRIRAGNRVLKANRKIKNPRALEALKIEPATPREAVLQFFINKGQINSGAIQDLYGNKAGKSIKGETNARIGIINNKTGLGIDEIAHQLWEQRTDERLTSTDFRDAVEGVINDHKGTSKMIDELLDEGRDVKDEFDMYNASHESEIIDEAADWFDSLTDAQKGELHKAETPSVGFDETINTFESAKTQEVAPLKESSTREDLQVKLDDAKAEMSEAQSAYDKAAKALSKDLGAKQTGMFEGTEQKLFDDTADMKAEVDARKKILDIKKEKVDNLQKQLDDTLDGQQEIPDITKDVDEESLRKEVKDGLGKKSDDINKGLDDKSPTDPDTEAGDIVKAKFLPLKEIIQAVAKPLNKFQEKVFGEQVDKAKDWLAKKIKAGNESSNIIKRWMSQFATSWSNGLPRTAADFKQKRFLKGNIRLANEKMAESIEKQHELVGNSVESLERIHQVLDPDFYSDNPTLFGKKVKYEDLTPNEQSLADHLRATNDYIHDWNFAMGMIDLKTYMTNKGKYIARLYEAFELPTDVQEFLDNNEMPIGNKYVKLGTDMFKARKEINEWKQNNIVKDPVFLTAKRMMQTETNAAILEYIDHIASQRGMVSKEAKPGFTQLNGKAYGKLDGAYVTNYIAEDFKGFFFGNQIVDLLYDVSKVYDRNQVKQFLKKYYTVFSPTVQLGNNSSNFVFAFLSGIDPITMASKYPAAIRDVRRKGATYKLLVKNGILGSDVITGDLRPLTAKTEAMTRETDKVKKTILDRAKQVDKAASDLYSGSDDVAKTSAFLALKEYGYSDAKAIELVYNGFQNYSSVGKIWDFASKTPLVGNPFIKFQADLQRIISNSVLRRPLSTAAFVGLLKVGAQLASNYSNEKAEEKEVREGRKFIPKIKLPEIMGGDVPLTFKTPGGEVNLARFLSPYYIYDTGDMKSPVEDFSKFLPYQAKMLEGRQKGSQDIYFPKQDPLLGTWWASIIDDVDFRGMSIQDPTSTRYRSSGATTTEKTLNAMNYIARSQVPLYSSASDMISSWQTGEDFYGRERSPMKVFLSTFIKTEDFPNSKYKEIIENSLENIKYKVDGYQTALSDINTTLRKELEKYSEKLEKKTITQEQWDKKQEELMKRMQERQLPYIEKIAEQQEEWNKISTKYANILK